MTVIRFTLSHIPPSVNAMYRAHRGQIILSKEYREWKRAAGFELINQFGFSGDLKEMPFIWRSDILFPCNVSKIDVDNAPKAIHDLLSKMGKVPDDRYLADSRVRWATGDKIIIAIQQEELPKWLKIKKMSSSLMRKLARHSSSTQPLL